MVAELLGFDAAMFFPTATMANEIAIRTLTELGDELLAAENCHLFTSETGGACNSFRRHDSIYTNQQWYFYGR
ncbi:MAG: hypothetical protein JSS07_03270 [Proteobacteria bacterium]|nr:hypothetical protein [Pseudomonadota bacterium]